MTVAQTSTGTLTAATLVRDGSRVLVRAIPRGRLWRSRTGRAWGPSLWDVELRHGGRRRTALVCDSQRAVTRLLRRVLRRWAS